jgi:hypothetical protein
MRYNDNRCNKYIVTPRLTPLFGKISQSSRAGIHGSPRHGKSAGQRSLLRQMSFILGFQGFFQELLRKVEGRYCGNVIVEL